MWKFNGLLFWDAFKHHPFFRAEPLQRWCSEHERIVSSSLGPLIHWGKLVKFRVEKHELVRPVLELAPFWSSKASSIVCSSSHCFSWRKHIWFASSVAVWLIKVYSSYFLSLLLCIVKRQSVSVYVVHWLTLPLQMSLSNFDHPLNA